MCVRKKSNVSQGRIYGPSAWGRFIVENLRIEILVIAESEGDKNDELSTFEMKERIMMRSLLFFFRATA